MLVCVQVININERGLCVCLCASWQVADYCCVLKMDSAVQVLQAQALLLKVFLKIGGRQSPEYISALTEWLMLCGPCESCEHLRWRLLVHSTHAGAW